jgi:cytidylate kinase
VQRSEEFATHRVRLADVLAQARDHAPNGTPVLLGVDGPSASGKSTVARKLAALGAAVLVEVDEFWTWGDDPAWWDYFVDQVLVPLADGRDARFRARNWATDTAGVATGEWVTTSADALVVVEGVTSTRRAVADLYAYRIWVDAPEASRLRRGIARDGEQHRDAWHEWLAVERDFFAEDQTDTRAHLHVDGEPPVPCDVLGEVVARRRPQP